jgi:ribokinase
VTPIVVVVGSINVDLTTFVERLPSPGETVIGGRFLQSHGGKGGNQAVAAARLGARTIMVGMVGDDDFGRAAIAELERERVITDHVSAGDSHTGVAEILVDVTGENLIAVASGANSELGADAVEGTLRSIQADDAVVLAVLEVSNDVVGAAATIAEVRGWRFVLNAAPARPLEPSLIARCDVVVSNEHEVYELGFSRPDALLGAGARAAVVTHGPRGAELLRPGIPPRDQPSFDVDVVDSTGAGDTFCGTLAVELANHRDLKEAVEIAAAAGALSTTREGARGGMPTRSELDDFLTSSRLSKRVGDR